MFKRILALMVVMLHVLTYSVPASLAADGWVVTDANGNVVSSGDNVNVAGGGAYNVANGNIAANQTVNVNVLNAAGQADPGSKAILNLTGGPSVWEGVLNVIGSVAFVNPSGFNIAQTFQGNVQGGAILSTLGINKEQFMAGMAELSRGLNQDPAAVINKGNWNIGANSYLALIGSAVKNEGVINANGGAAVLAAGDQVKLDISSGSGLISVAVDKAVSAPVYDSNGNKISDAVANSGVIKANGGVAILSARAIEQIFDNVINHTGIIEANSITNVNGRIILNGGDLGITSVSGTLKALGDDLGEKGGEIQVLGQKIGLWDGSTIDASGYNGGGTVLVGGDYQGLGALPVSEAIYQGKWSDIKADAFLEGNGGKVVLFSKDSTKAYGTISARGGQLSGDGGLIETSSEGSLDVSGVGIDASAPAGQGGTWLLDPYTITLGSGGSNTAGGVFTSGGPASSTVNVSDINTQLSGGTNVTITASGANGDITLAAGFDIAKTGFAGAATLTLNATRNISLNGTIGAAAGLVGFLNVVLNTTTNGGITFSNTINTNGGNLTVTTAGSGGTATFSTANADINTNGGAVNFNLSKDFNMNNGGSSITTSGGQVDITASDSVDTQTINSGAGNINLTATNGNMGIGTALTTTTGSIKANAADGINLSSAVHVTTGGGNFTADANTDGDSTGDFGQGAGGSFINTGNGNISISGKGVSLTGSLTTTGGNIGLTATNGDVFLTQAVTTGTGDINLNGENGVKLSGSSADLTTSGGAVNINANTNGDADGDYAQDSSGGSISTSGGNVSVTANDFQLAGTTNAGSGSVSLLGAQAGSKYLVGTGSSSGFTGAITGAEMQGITANNLTIGGSNVSTINVRGITAANSNNIGTVHVNATAANGNVTFDSAASSFKSLDVNAGNNVTVSQNVATTAGGMTVTADSDASGAGTFQVDAARTLSTNGNSFLANAADVNVAGAINTGTGAVNGGNITINGSNQITIANTGSLNTTIGAGGIFSAAGAVTVNGTITLGQGNITLNGGGASPDLIITVPIISATSIFLSAVRDIIVQALLKTTNPADGNITLRADSDNDGSGGVWVQNTGAIDAAQNVTLTGSDIFAIGGTKESVQVDADGVNNQVLAAGNIDINTAGFAPAGSNMNLNGIIKSTGVGNTITVNSVGNINTSDDGVAELISDNQSLNAGTGIDAEIDAKNVSFNNSTSGNVSLEDMAGGLTVTGAVNGGSGSTTILTHSPLTIASDMVQSGAINLTAGENAGAGDDLTVNGGVTVRSTNDNVILKAGDNVNLNAGSTVKSDNAGVSVTAGSGDTDNLGDVNLAGAVNSFGSTILNALKGAITQTAGSITAANLQFSAKNNVALTNSANNFAAVTGSSSTGSINLGNGAAAATIGNLTTAGQDITYNHSGSGSVDIAGTIDSGNAGSANGGNITVNNLGGALTVKNTAVLTSLAGVGGAFSATNVTIEGGSTITVGQGNITLNGGGIDLIINVPIISATSIFLSAIRDIIVQALVQTTNPGDGNITLRADSDNDGSGGVWVQNTGAIDAAQNVTLTGSDIFAIGGTKESVQVDADGVNNQVLAAGNIDINTAGFAPAGSNMNLNGIIKSTGVGNTITVNSVGNINTSDDGVAELISDNQSLNAGTGIDAEIDAKNISFNNSTSGNVSLEDMAGGLTVTGAVNGGSGTTTILTHSPLTIAANMIQAGTINLTAGESFGAGDNLTLNSGITVQSTAGDLNLKAGDNVALQSGSLAKSDTGDVNVTAGNGDTDGLGNINLNGGQINAAGNAKLDAVGSINGTADGVADVVGNTINLTANSGGINNLDVTAATELNATTTNDNGSILLNSIGDLPVGLVNAGTGDVTLNSTGGIFESVVDDGAPVADVIGGTLNFNTTGSDIGKSTSYLDIEPSTLWNANSNGGSIYINCIGACPMGVINLGTGTFFYTGDIVDGNDVLFGEYNGALVNLIAGAAHIIAPNRIGSSTNAIEMELHDAYGIAGDGVLIASTGTGGTFITNKNTTGNGLTIAPVTGGTLTSLTSAGDIVVQEESPLNVLANVTAAGNISLSALGNTSADDLTIGPNVTVSSTGAGNILLTAGHNISTGAFSLASTTGSGQVNVWAGEDFKNGVLDSDGQQNGSVIMDADSAFKSQNGNINVDAHESARLSLVDADSDANGVRGDISVNARNGFISDTNGGNVNLKGNAATLRAAQGVGDGSVADNDDLETDLVSVDVINSTSGHVHINETSDGGDLNIIRANQQGAGDLNIRTNDGSLTVVSAGSGGFGVSATSGETTLKSADGNLSGNDHLNINNTVTSTTGKINLDSDNDVNFSVEGDVTSGSGEIEVDATDFLTMSDNGADSTILNAGTGRIDLDAGLDINLASVKTTSTLDDAVVIVSRGGRIIDGGDTDGFNVRTGALAEDPNVFDGGLILSAFNGIGRHTDALGGLETKVGKLAAHTVSNDIQVFNTGALNITTLTDPDPTTSLGFPGAGTVTGVKIDSLSGSFIFITSASPMLISADVTNLAGGDISLFSLGNLTTDTMTINANVRSIGEDGNVFLASGGSMFQSNGTVVSTTGNGVTPGLGNILMTAGENMTGQSRQLVGAGLTQDGNAAADLIMGATASVRTDGGDGLSGGVITMNANRNFLVGEVNADAAGPVDEIRGNVFTNSFTGDTLDADTSAVLNITANVLTMFSGGVIGLPLDPVETKANNINAFAIGNIYLENLGNVLINLKSVTGNIGFRNTGNIFLGGAHAVNGVVDLTASQNIFSVTGGTNVSANDRIGLTAGGVIGTGTNPVSTSMIHPGVLQVNAGGQIDGLSGSITADFDKSHLQFLNNPPGLFLLNGVPVGGQDIEALSTALFSDLFAESNRFNDKYTDYPGYSKLEAQAPFYPSIDTSRLDTLPVLEALPPTVVPIPGEAKEERKAAPRVEAPKAPAAPAAAQPQVQGQNPPTIVPIPAEAVPTLEPNVEQKNNNR